MGDRVVEVGEFCDGEGVTATDLEDLRSDFWGVGVGQVGEEIKGKRGNGLCDVNKGCVDTVYGGAAHESDDVHGDFGFGLILWGLAIVKGLEVI